MKIHLFFKILVGSDGKEEFDYRKKLIKSNIFCEF